MNSKLTNGGRKVLVAVLVLSLVTTPVLGFLVPAASPVGVAAAQEDSAGDDVCDSQLAASWLSPLTSAGLKVYCAATGLFDSPSDASNSAELEEGAYVQHGSIAETFNNMQSDVNDKADEWRVFAYSDGEKAIIEARYNDESKAYARGQSRLAVNDLYSNQYATLYEGHNDIWEESYTWGQATTENVDSETIISVRLQEHGDASGSLMSSATVEFGENATLEYSNVTLPSGNTTDVVTRISDVTVTSSQAPDNYSHADLRIYDADGGKNMAVVWYNSTGGVVKEYGGVDTMDIVGNNPNGGEDAIHIGSGQYWLSNAINNELDSDRTKTLSDVETRTDEVYNEIGPGEVHPSEYMGPREFYQTYGSAMNQSVAAQLYFHQTIGYETAPNMSMVVNDSGTVYEGGVMVDESTNPPLVYDETPTPLSSNGDVVLSSHDHQGVIEFNNNSDNESVATITFTDNSDHTTTDVGIDVINVENESVARDGDNITATFTKEDMQDEEFVIFETTHNGTASGTYVLFTDSETTEIRGFVVGEEYSGHSMLYLNGAGEVENTQLSNSWTLEENYDASGNSKAVAVTHEGVDTSFSGTSVKERIETQQTIKDAVNNNDDIISNPGGGGGGDDGISSWMAGLGGFALAIVLVMCVGFLLLVLYLVGNVTSVA